MTKEKLLIINADDFGLHEEINWGIYDAHHKGVLTSTTLIPCGTATLQASKLAKESPNLGIGVHLTLVGGLQPILPLSDIPSLVTSQGVFRNSHLSFIRDWSIGKIDKIEIENEWRAQIEKILDLDLPISHIDSHQHLHVLPGLQDLVPKLATQYRIPAIRIPKEPYSFFETSSSTSPIRILSRTGLSFCAHQAKKKWNSLSSPDHFFGMLTGGNMTLKNWEKLIPLIPVGVSEVMTHPGRNNRILSQPFSWGYHWQEELAALQSKEIAQWIKKNSIKLINYRNLKSKNPIAGTSC